MDTHARYPLSSLSYCRQGVQLLDTKIDEYVRYIFAELRKVDQDGSYARVLTVSTRFDS
jgi:hypothetical protein